MLNPDRSSRPHQERTGPRTDSLQVGDRVAYTKAFLQSIGAYTGDMPHAKGVITDLKRLSEETTLAEITWDRPELPSRVNVKNLCRVGSRAYHD